MPMARNFLAIALAVACAFHPADATADLTYVTEWGSFGSGPSQFNFPLGIALSPGGDLYVADGANNRVSRFTADGQFVASFGSLGSAPGQFREPNHLQFSPTNGDLYVTDLNNARIQRFTAEGAFVLAWGTQGPGPGQFLAPWGIHIDASGNVWVACRDQTRVQKFSENGGFLEQWGGGPGQFPRPHGIVTDAAGNVYISDVERHDVQKYDSTGEYVLQWGSPGSVPGEFLHPHHLTYVGGEIVVVDWLEHPHGGRLTSFDTSGVLTGVVISGTQGTAPLQFHTIIQAATDGQGTWWVVEWGNHRVQKLRDAAVGVETWSTIGSSTRVLGDPFPNPSSGAVRLALQLPPSASECELAIFDVSGKRVLQRILHSSLPSSAGFVWDGVDGTGRAVGAGVYFLAVSGDGFHEMRKMVRVR